MKPTEEEMSCLSYNTTLDRLICLNNVKARLYLPVTILLAVLVVVGTLGNTTVCLVYWRRTSRASSHYFILSLAVLDLMTCVVGMPFEIADLVLPYTFRFPLACKTLRFIHSTTIIASSTILIQVAFDRYYRICKLGRQFTANKARLLCFGAFVLGVVCAWPSVVIFGRKTVKIYLGGETLQGEDCSTDDSMRSTIYPTIYYAFLFSLFGLTVAFFAVLYAKIGLTILHRKKMGLGSSNGGSTSGQHGGPHRAESWRKKVQAAEPQSSEYSSGQEYVPCISTESSSVSNNSTGNSSHRSSKTLTPDDKRGARNTTEQSDRDSRNMKYKEENESDKNTEREDKQADKNVNKECNNGEINGREEKRKSTENNLNGGREASGGYDAEGDDSARSREENEENTSSNSNRCKDHDTTGDRNSSNSRSRSTDRRHKRSSSNVNREEGRKSRNSNLGDTSSPGPIPHINKTLITSSSTQLASIMIESLNRPAKPLRKPRSSVDVESPRSPTSPSEKIRAFFFHFHHQTHHKEELHGVGIFSPNESENGNSHVPKYRIYRRATHGNIKTESRDKSASRSGHSGRQLRVGKTTTVLFAVTLAYILSFLPYLTVMVMRSIVKDLESGLSPMGELAYKLCVKSFFINNAINPLIYSFLNQAFRQDARNMFNKMCGKKSSLPRR